VTLVDVVLTELRGERALRIGGPREGDEPARVAVEPMDDAEAHFLLPGAPQELAGVLDERFLVALLVGDAEDTRGLVHDDDVPVDEDDRVALERSLGELGSVPVDGDDRALGNAGGGVDAALAVDGDAAFGAEGLRARPGEPGLLADAGREGGMLGAQRFRLDWRSSGFTRSMSACTCSRLRS